MDFKLKSITLTLDVASDAIDFESQLDIQNGLPIHDKYFNLENYNSMMIQESNFFYSLLKKWFTFTSHFNPYEYLTGESILLQKRVVLHQEKNIDNTEEVDDFYVRNYKLIFTVPDMPNLDPYYYLMMDLLYHHSDKLYKKQNIMFMDKIHNINIHDKNLILPSSIIDAYLDYKYIKHGHSDEIKKNLFGIYFNENELKYNNVIDNISTYPNTQFNYSIDTFVSEKSLKEIQSYPMMDIIIIKGLKKRYYNHDYYFNGFFKTELLIKILISLMKLNNDGHLICRYPLPICRIHYEILFIITMLFKSVDVFKSEVEFRNQNTLMLICKDFISERLTNKRKQSINTTIDGLIEWNTSLSKTTNGLSKITEVKQEKINEDTVKRYIKEYNSRSFVHNLFQFNCSDNPYHSEQFMTNIKRIVGKINERRQKKMTMLIEQHGKLKGMSRKDRDLYLFDVMQSQIKNAELWCKKVGIPIKPFYKELKKIGEEHIIELSYEYKRKIFPPKPGIDYNKLMMTDVGRYSVTPYYDSDKLSRIIASHFNDPKSITITDGTSGLGGNVLSFSKFFKHVNAVEYSSLHCKILTSNLVVYDARNITIICDDYMKHYLSLKQDVVFVDPPWGGPLYKDVPKLDMYLGKHDIADVIRDLLPNCKYIFMKCPFNYNIKNLEHQTEQRVKKYQFKKYYILEVRGKK